MLSHGINARCNLSCSFCEYWRKPGREMRTPDIYKMLDEARAFGIGVYNAWTVEPLLRPDLPDILEHAKGLGLVTSLITNGSLLRKRADELSDLDYLSVSVDGISCYRELRGIELQEVIEGIKAAQSSGHEVLMNCVISGRNLGELGDLVRLAQDLETWISFEPLHESRGIPKDVWDAKGIRDRQAYEKAVEGLIELKRVGAPIINSETYLSLIKSTNPHFKCHASDIILHVSSDGTIENCRVHREPLGSVSEGLENAWAASANKRRETVKSCRGCLFFGYVENSLLYEFVPEVVAHYEWM